MLENIISIVRSAGEIILDTRDFSVSQKSNFMDLVTDCDLNVQRFLIKELSGLIPEAGFVCEEESVSDCEKNIRFVIDPIDGTTNFVSDYKHSGISVALQQGGETLCGVVYNPFSDEMFSAIKGGGAQCNGREIHVTGRKLKNSIAAVGTSPYNRALADKTFELIKAVYSSCSDIRRRGSASLDFCDVAYGRTALMFELELHVWDYCAAEIIVKEAGGEVFFLNGNENGLGAPCGVAMATPEAMEVFHGIYNRIFMR